MSLEFEQELFKRLPEISKRFGPTFHIYHEAGIRKDCQRLKKAFTDQSLNFQEFYAVKALPNPFILDIVQSEGFGFDCSSIRELKLARAAGAMPKDIMFTSNNTDENDFVEALSYGGCILNLDDVELIKKVPTNLLKYAHTVCLRLNPGLRKTGDEVNSIIGNPVDSKYGVPIENIVPAYEMVQEKFGFEKPLGLHTMVCSNDRDYTHMVSTVKLLLEVAADLKEQLGVKLEFLNMGGGVGIPYRPGDTAFDVEALARECKVLLDEFEQTYGYRPALYMESGRFITGPHGALVNPVINRYKKYKSFIGVPTAMPGLMRVAIYSTAYHHATVLRCDGVPRPLDGPTEVVTIAGKICENCDVLARDILLPVSYVGDIIVTHDTGAHCSAMGPFTYNGQLTPPELLLRIGGSVRLIKWGMTQDDLTRPFQGLEGTTNVLVAQV